jgi:hypothetical protein
LLEDISGSIDISIMLGVADRAVPHPPCNGMTSITVPQYQQVFEEGKKPSTATSSQPYHSLL